MKHFKGKIRCPDCGGVIRSKWSDPIWDFSHSTPPCARFANLNGVDEAMDMLAEAIKANRPTQKKTEA